MTRPLALIALLMCAACTSGPLEAEEASFTVRVTSAPSSDRKDLIARHETYVPVADIDSGYVVLHLTRSMRVFVELSDGSYKPVGRDELAAGRRIMVWTTGVELRSLPPQYFAVQILVLR